MEASHEDSRRHEEVQGDLPDRIADLLAERRCGLVDDCPVGAITGILIHQRGRIVYTNSMFQRMTGYTAEELREMEAWDLCIPEEREELRSLICAEPSMLQGAVRHKICIERKDAKRIWLETIATDVELGGQAYRLAACHDVTAQEVAHERLREANRRLIEAREEERQYLARELHESVAQDLVVLQLLLTHVTETQPAQTQSLRRAQALSGEIIRHIRHLCQTLPPPSPETEGLGEALENLARLYRPGGIEVAVHLHCDGSGITIGRATQLVLYRVVQTAVAMAVRHAQARRVDVDVSCDAGVVRLDVRNDGPSAWRLMTGTTDLSTVGLMGRVRNIGGTIRVEVGKDGPVLHVEAPLNSGEADA